MIKILIKHLNERVENNMVEKLNQVNELIDSSKKVPTEIKPIVKAICKGYIREFLEKFH